MLDHRRIYNRPPAPASSDPVPDDGRHTVHLDPLMGALEPTLDDGPANPVCHVGPAGSSPEYADLVSRPPHPTPQSLLQTGRQCRRQQNDLGPRDHQSPKLLHHGPEIALLIQNDMAFIDHDAI